MMDNLLTALDKMQDVLTALAETMAAEQQQLSVGRLNRNLLQRITEDKHSLLTTLHYFDQRRREAETQSHTQAPYPHYPQCAQRWQSIQQATLALRDTNAHNGMLLELQMAHNSKSLALLKPHQSQKFYGPNGLAFNTPSLSRKI